MPLTFFANYFYNLEINYFPNFLLFFKTRFAKKHGRSRSTSKRKSFACKIVCYGLLFQTLSCFFKMQYAYSLLIKNKLGVDCLVFDRRVTKTRCECCFKCDKKSFICGYLCYVSLEKHVFKLVKLI